MDPVVSIVMSVYNGEDMLRNTIESILKQTVQNFEFIIINDGSTDRSKEIILSYADKRICIYNQENKGLACALNLGIVNSSGKYIARMDADDIARKNRI